MSTSAGDIGGNDSGNPDVGHVRKPYNVQLGIEAARISRTRDGKLRAMPCLMRYEHPTTVANAIELVRKGRVAFVAKADAETVLKEFEE